jgi:hypothetical protein
MLYSVPSSSGSVPASSSGGTLCGEESVAFFISVSSSVSDSVSVCGGTFSGACPDFLAYSSLNFHKLRFVTRMSSPSRSTVTSPVTANLDRAENTSDPRVNSKRDHTETGSETLQESLDLPSICAAMTSRTRQYMPYLASPSTPPSPMRRAIFSSFVVAVMCLIHFI